MTVRRKNSGTKRAPAEKRVPDNWRAVWSDALSKRVGAAWFQRKPADSDTQHAIELPGAFEYKREWRAAFAEPVMYMLRDIEAKHPSADDGAAWVEAVLLRGPDALLRTAVELLGTKDMGALRSNVLSALGNMISVAFRREFLRGRLYAHDFNLGRVSDELRLGGAGNVSKLARELGLDNELTAARKLGKATRGRPRKSD